MNLLFWICLALVTYTYFGYIVLLWIQAVVRPRPVTLEPILPPVSILIAVRNEEANIGAKLANLRLLEYPRHLLQVIIVSDGSTDRTVEMLWEQAPFVVPVILQQSRGKAFALNEAVKHAAGEVILFLDARQSIDLGAVAALVSCFADPAVGAASGELLLETNEGLPSPDALGIYWKIEKAVRRLESTSGSVVGVTGAVYAIRRELYTEIPAETILDDVFIPMNVVRMGKRVVFQPSAVARDRIFNDKGKEFSRKVRTLTGNYQLLRLAPWLLSTENPLLFRFISHKLLRLIVPLLLMLMLFASATVPGLFFRMVFWLQIAFYALAGLGGLSPPLKAFTPVAIANTFVMLNAAAALAFYNVISGRKKVWL